MLLFVTKKQKNEGTQIHIAALQGNEQPLPLPQLPKQGQNFFPLH